LLENAVAYLIDDMAGLPAGSEAQFGAGLVRVSPNPFRQGSKITYFIPSRQNVNLAVYDVRGRLVRTLVSGSQEAGFHDVAWQGDDMSKRQVSPGIYFSRLATTAHTETGKLVKMR
jgi:hypothetical protein